MLTAQGPQTSLHCMLRSPQPESARAGQCMYGQDFPTPAVPGPAPALPPPLGSHIRTESTDTHFILDTHRLQISTPKCMSVLFTALEVIVLGHGTHYFPRTLPLDAQHDLILKVHSADLYLVTMVFTSTSMDSLPKSFSPPRARE